MAREYTPIIAHPRFMNRYSVPRLVSVLLRPYAGGAVPFEESGVSMRGTSAFIDVRLITDTVKV